MAYLKQWAARAFNELELRVPSILPGPGEALHLEAVEAASRVDADIAYIDPPYNQHSYMGNYHVWESLVRWDKPETYGIANKRVQCKDYKSDFNSKRRIRQGLQAVFEAVRCKHLLVSFNNEGHVDREEMIALLSQRGRVGVVAVDFKRYVGAQIGIHNPRGEKVGQVSHLRNKEYFFVVSERRDTVDSVVRAIESSIEDAALALSAAKGKRKGHEPERRVE
jgi:adenine-specific DNA-methyltransferase